jgi:hypothetical protein
LLGYSSGAAVAAAVRVALEAGAGKRVLTLAPDTGERYLSTSLFAEDAAAGEDIARVAAAARESGVANAEGARDV